MSGVLISGATTPLGRRVVDAVRSAGIGPVLAIGVEDEELASASLPQGVRYLQVDLTRPRFVRRLLFGPVRDMRIDTIVHLAAHRDASDEGSGVHRLNVEATRLMLRLAENHPTVKRFVHRSSAHVYANRTDQSDILREDSPLNLSPEAPQWVRDRVEADVTVCGRMGLTDLQVQVLRCAEILAPDMGSQLHDYLSSRFCLRPLGYDPMLEVLSLGDAAEAFRLALASDAEGVFNIPGSDVLSLSHAIALWGRTEVSVPGALLGPVYAARQAWRGGLFRYDLNRWRFHFNAVLDGARARDVLGYVPSHPIDWPAAKR